MRVRLLIVGYVSNEISHQCTVSQYACMVIKRRIRQLRDNSLVYSIAVCVWLLSVRYVSSEISHQCTVSQYACRVIKRTMSQ